MAPYLQEAEIAAEFGAAPSEMNLTTLLKLASTRLDAERGGVSTSNLAFAEVDADGNLVTVNPLASMKWGWQQGTPVRGEMRIALEGLAGNRPTELPLKFGGLHIGAIVREENGGWLVFGYDPESPPTIGQTKPGQTDGTEKVRGGIEDNETAGRVEGVTGSMVGEEEVNGASSGSASADVGRPGRDRSIQATVNTLRMLATTTPEQTAFCDAAMQAMAAALNADRVLYFVRNGRGDLVLGSTSEIAARQPRAGTILTDDHPVFQLIGARGSATHVNRAIAPVVCKQVGFTEAVVASVRDQGHVAGYVFVVCRPGTMNGPSGSAELLKHVDQLVSVFSSLYSWIAMISRHREMASAMEDVLFSFQAGPGSTRRYGFISDRIDQFTGYHPEELTDNHSRPVRWIDQVVHEEDRERVRQETTLLQQGDETVLDYRIRHRNGSTRWVREIARAHTDSLGMRTIVGVLKDVSEIRAVESMVEDARKDAEAARRSRTAFIATLSHEVRTPLGALSGYAQLLGKELTEYEESTGNRLPDQVHEFAEVLTNRSYRLLGLVHDLFELSNLETGGTTLHREAIPLHPVIQASVAKIAQTLERKNVELALELNAEEPSVWADTHSLVQIIDNVLSNATKFTEKGRVTIRTAQERDSAVVEVEDTGIGISEEYQCDLFEAFSQEENWRNRRFGGTGLGLALSRRLLDLLDGQIEVESEKGTGSTFRIFLPLATDQSALTRPSRA